MTRRTFNGGTHMSDFITTGEAARLLGVPIWKIRRIVDRLDANIPRAVAYRLIPRDLLPAIREQAAIPTPLGRPRSKELVDA